MAVGKLSPMEAMDSATTEVGMTTKTAQGVITEAAAQSVLRRSGTRELAPSEEKVMRMRLGAPLPRTATLEWVGWGNEDLEIELRALEIETYLKLRDHEARRAPAPRSSRAKEKIIRALRRTGPTR